MDKFKEILHVINNARPMQWVILIFAINLTLDFHEFYKAHFFEFTEWQNIGVASYAALIGATLKTASESIFKRREKDD